MLAPVRCPLVQLMIGPSQAQSSGHEGHLHVHGTPTTVTDPWIGAKKIVEGLRLGTQEVGIAAPDPCHAHGDS